MYHVWAEFFFIYIILSFLSCFRGLGLPTVSWGRSQSLRGLSNLLKTTQLSDRGWDANCGISGCLLPWCYTCVLCPFTHRGLMLMGGSFIFCDLATLLHYSIDLASVLHDSNIFLTFSCKKSQTLQAVSFLSLYTPCPSSPYNITERVYNMERMRVTFRSLIKVQDTLNSRVTLRGWGYGSVWKVLDVQAISPTFRSQHSHKELGLVVHTCDSSAKEGGSSLAQAHPTQPSPGQSEILPQRNGSCAWGMM